MSLFLLGLLSAIVVLAGAYIGVFVWMRFRKGSLARRQTAAWNGFADMCPEPGPGPDEPVYPLKLNPGPAGEVVVRPDGLCLRLTSVSDRRLWAPWEAVRQLDPATNGGVLVTLRGGLLFQVSALAGRSIYEAQAASLRRGGSSLRQAAKTPSSLA